MSVSFTDGIKAPDDAVISRTEYLTDETGLGRVYIPKEGVLVTGPICVRYEKYPWLEKFEVDGLRPAPPKRAGIGSKDLRGFVKSLSTIYSRAYDDYREYVETEPNQGDVQAMPSDKNAAGNTGTTAAEYFAHVTRYFIGSVSAEPGNAGCPEVTAERQGDHPGAVRMFRRFCGFTENMWREGDGEMLEVCMQTMLPLLREDETAWQIFLGTVTEEFREFPGVCGDG